MAPLVLWDSQEGPTAGLDQQISKPGDFSPFSSLYIHLVPQMGQQRMTSSQRGVFCEGKPKVKVLHITGLFMLFDWRGSFCIAFEGIFISTKNNSNKRQS